jgi:hypothetical protein
VTTAVDRDLAPHVRPATRIKRVRVVLEEDEEGWRLDTTVAKEAGRLRRAFREYLEAYGHPAGDFDAAELLYGELVANCVEHAPGRLRIEFRWYDSTLTVIDTSDRLRTWPFSAHDACPETTIHSFTILTSLTARVQLARESSGGTRASVVLPVLRNPDVELTTAAQ